MNIQTEISTIERRLRLARIPLQRLFGQAAINASTWTRWRSGRVSPRLNTWLAAQQAADDLICTAASHAVPLRSEARV